MDRKHFVDCVDAINALFYLICSNVGLSTLDKIELEHMYDKVTSELSMCFKEKMNEG